MDSYFENRGQKWSTQNTNIVTGDMDSPRRELSSGGLESVVTLLVRWQINYLFASPRKKIQLYERIHSFASWNLKTKIKKFNLPWFLYCLFVLDSYFFCVFIFLYLNWCAIVRYGWQLSTAKRWASNFNIDEVMAFWIFRRRAQNTYKNPPEIGKKGTLDSSLYFLLLPPQGSSLQSILLRISQAGGHWKNPGAKQITTTSWIKTAPVDTAHFSAKSGQVHFVEAVWLWVLILGDKMTTQRHTDGSFLWHWQRFRSFLGGLVASIASTILIY